MVPRYPAHILSWVWGQMGATVSCGNLPRPAQELLRNGGSRGCSSVPAKSLRGHSTRSSPSTPSKQQRGALQTSAGAPRSRPASAGPAISHGGSDPSRRAPRAVPTHRGQCGKSRSRLRAKQPEAVPSQHRCWRTPEDGARRWDSLVCVEAFILGEEAERIPQPRVAEGES